MDLQPEKHGLLFDIKKCTTSGWALGDENVIGIRAFKDLGIDISSSLVWNDHIRRVVNKCNKKNGYDAIGFNVPEKVSRSLFTALVTSDVEYGSSLWSGTSKRNLQLIEGIQRRATNYILHYPDLDYRECLTKLKLPPLYFRREILLLI